MQKLTEVLGAYGAYVWPAFGVTALAMLWITLTSLHSLRKTSRTLAQLSHSDEA